MLEWSLNSYLSDVVGLTCDESQPFTSLDTQGVSNYAFRFKSKRGKEFIIRLKGTSSEDELQSVLASYWKEQWVAQQLHEQVPVPEIPEAGIGILPEFSNGKRYAFVIQQLLPFQNAYGEQCERKRKHLLHQLGQIASVVNSTPVSGFGSEFLSSDACFSYTNYRAYAESKMLELRFEELLPYASLNTQQFKQYMKFIEPLFSIAEEPTLYHADFANNWGNILTDERGNVQAVIDWEMCGGGPAGIIELGSMLYVYIRDGVKPELLEKEFGIFLHGYGISPSEYKESYEEHVHQFIAFQALLKLHRYMDMEKAGHLEGAPWRIAFRDRVRRLVTRIGVIGRAYLEDCPY